MDFDADTQRYSAAVIYEIDHVVVTPVAVDPYVHSVWVGLRDGDIPEGDPRGYVPRGHSSPRIPLVNGEENAVDVVVTAEDGIHVITYTNYIWRPQYSLSQFERLNFIGEWRRTQYRDEQLLTLGGHWDPCTQGSWDIGGGEISPLECRENSWELILNDYHGVRHTMRGWYEVNTFQSPVMLILDVMEATGMYEQYKTLRLQGWYRFTDWPTPATDGLSTRTRTHSNIEVDLAQCVSLRGTNATVDNSVKTDGDMVGAELLVAPQSKGPYGWDPWSCPLYSPFLGNDTSRFYLQGLRDIDECKDGTDQCSVDAICTNTYGSRWCACKAGYAGNPYFGTCEDVDECERETHSCGEHTHCINKLGTYNCSCDTGHEGNPSVYSFDVDITPDSSIDVLKQPGQEWECVSVHENHTCQRVPTVYPTRLQSARGGRQDSVADPSRPEDQEQMWHFDDPVNSEYHYKSQHYYREKTDPQYVRALTESVPYPPPRWQFDGRPAEDNSCSDVDECATEFHGCSDNGYCYNVPGSFSCHCHIGYAGDPYSPTGCVDVNECAEIESTACSDNSLCINVPGTYLCECPAARNHNGQLFWNDRAPGKPYNSKCHMPLRQSRAFVTFERWTGEQINTLNGADAKCHSEGPELQPGFRWQAVLSDAGTDARHHLTAGETNILYPVIRTDGELLAVDPDQLWHGLALPIRQGTSAVRGSKQYVGLANPISVDGSGAPIDVEAHWTGGHEVWTGSDLNGARMQHADCWSWREQNTFAQNQVGGAAPTAGDDPAYSS